MARIAVSTFIESIGGRPVVVKHRLADTVDQHDPDRLAVTDPASEMPQLLPQRQTELEGQWLRAARHRHVVRLRRALPTEAALATDHAGLHNLATCRHAAAPLASVLATVASTVAELHSRGLVHGRLVPSHIILRGPQLLDPVLCSPSADGEEHIPARRDVAALAALAGDLSRSATEQGERSGAWAGWSRAIEMLADEDAAMSALAASELFASLAQGPRRSRLRG